MRTFEISLRHGTNNILKTTATIHADTIREAHDIFCTEIRCIGYPPVMERAETINGRLHSVWSAGCNISGQRIWIKESH